MKKYPIPSVLLAERKEPGTYEIIDGMQRLHTIISFIEGAFPSLSGAGFNHEHFTTAKTRLDEKIFVPQESKNKISGLEVGTFLNYPLAVSVIRNVTEPEVNDVFDRINTYGHRLSDQERRQAGVQNDFVNCVRKIACSIRGDVSVDVLPLRSMPTIMIDLPMSKHGYEIRADEVFWVRNGILTAKELRDSLDEQCIADLVASLVAGEILQRTKAKLDQIYDSQDAESDRILTLFNLYGEERVSQEIKYCIEQIDKVCRGSTLKRILFGTKQANAFPSLFAVIFFAFHDLLIRQSKQIRDSMSLRQALGSLMKDRRVNTGKDATLAEKRKNNITVIRALISHEFVDGGNIADIYSHPTTIDIEAIIRRTEIELPSYELKQGILRLTDERELDHDALDRIIQTVAAIANNGQNLSGKIILGVADKKSDVERIVKLDQIQPRIVGKRTVVGIKREAKALGKSVEEYFHLIRDRIRKSGLSEPLKGDTLSHLDFNTFYDLGVLVISIPSQTDISYYGDEVYYRDGDQTKEAEGPRRVAEISKRFQRSN